MGYTTRKRWMKKLRKIMPQSWILWSISKVLIIVNFFNDNDAKFNTLAINGEVWQLMWNFKCKEN